MDENLGLNEMLRKRGAIEGNEGMFAPPAEQLYPMKIIRLLILVICFGWTNHVRANNYYLNFTGGSDSNHGSTTSTAWKTWDKIRSYGAKSNYQPGDTISLLKGDTWTQGVSYWNALGNGGTNTPIILGSWGTSSTRPIIEAIPGADYCISFRNMSYWTIQNIMFANADWACILLLPESSNVTNIKVLNCEVTSNVIPFHYVRVGNLDVQEITNVEFGSVTKLLEKDVRELTARTMPILDNVEVITDKVRNIADNIDDQVELVKDSINSIREIANNVVDLERRIQERIEEPVLETVGTIAAVLKGVRAFFVRLRA